MEVRASVYSRSEFGQVHGMWGLRRRLPGQLLYDVRRQELALPVVLLHRLRQLPGCLSLRRHRDRRRLGRLSDPPIALLGGVYTRQTILKSVDLTPETNYE